jgi:hypothetical protein
MVCLARAYTVVSAAVSVTVVLALARAGDLVGETQGKSCGDMWDTVRWSFLIASCHISDVSFIDIVNGGIVVLVVLAALIPTLLFLRIILLILILLYMKDITSAHALGQNFAGLELWWVPIFYLSILILIVAIVTAVFRSVKKWRGSSGATRRVPQASGANRPEGSG